MRIPKRVAIIFALSLLLILTPLRAAAERFCDLSIGGSLRGDEDLVISTPIGKVTDKVSTDTSLTGGYRLGYWFDSHPWVGIAFEASLFQQNSTDIKLQVIPVSALLMFRIPLLKSRFYHRGELLPYAGIGPCLFFSDIEYTVEAGSVIPTLLGPSFSGTSGTYTDNSIDVGLDARVGIAKMLPRNIALFSEYRFTRVTPNFEENVLGVNVKIENELNTHHLLIGFSYFF